MQRLPRSRCVQLAVVGFVWTIMMPICGIPATITPTEGRAPVDIPVQKIVLFSSGVGYFEHMGSVVGNSSTELRFKTNQINDILKSLVLQDLGGGKVGTVVYPSQDPLAKTLRSFQIDLSNNPSLAELLTQIRGSQVQVTIQAEHLQGTVLGLEKKQKLLSDKQIIEVWVLNLVAGGTVRSVPLDEVQHVELEDSQLQEELHKALLALAQARDQAKKPVVITFEGTGDRRVRVGYIIETPIWKTSYRLLLPERPEEPAKIQGWAIVENQTENDWNNAQLSLVSGRPISFVQELYTPLLPAQASSQTGILRWSAATNLRVRHRALGQQSRRTTSTCSSDCSQERALTGESGGMRLQEPMATTELGSERADNPLDPTGASSLPFQLARSESSSNTQ